MGRKWLGNERHYGDFSGTPARPARRAPPPTAFDATRDAATAVHLVPAHPSPRARHQVLTQLATRNRLDDQAVAQLRAKNPRVAILVTTRGSLDAARNPRAALTARYPNGRRFVALGDGASPAPAPASGTPCTTVAVPRRERVLFRAHRANDTAAIKHALITYPDAVFDHDKRGRTCLHLAADEGRATHAILLLAARALPCARDRGGLTPVDLPEYWAARAPLPPT